MKRGRKKEENEIRTRIVRERVRERERIGNILAQEHRPCVRL